MDKEKETDKESVQGIKDCMLVIERGEYRRKWNQITEVYGYKLFGNLLINLEVMEANDIDVKGYKLRLMKRKNGVILSQRNF